MSEKTGLSQILEHRRHPLLVGQWPGMVLPWTLIAAVAVVLPFFVARSERARQSLGTERFRAASVGVPVVRLVVGRRQSGCVLLVVGRQAQLLRPVPARHGIADRRGLGRTGADGPRAGEMRRGHPCSRRSCRHSGCCSSSRRSWRRSSCASRLAQEVWPWCLAIALALSVAVALSVHSWRRGATSIALAPLAAACVIGFLVAYGRIAPQENPERSHRALAQKLGEIVPAGAPTVMFFNEIDEGLWFYAKGFDLRRCRKSSALQHGL